MFSLVASFIAVRGGGGAVEGVGVGVTHACMHTHTRTHTTKGAPVFSQDLSNEKKIADIVNREKNHLTKTGGGIGKKKNLF